MLHADIDHELLDLDLACAHVNRDAAADSHRNVLLNVIGFVHSVCLFSNIINIISISISILLRILFYIFCACACACRHFISIVHLAAIYAHVINLCTCLLMIT